MVRIREWNWQTVKTPFVIVMMLFRFFSQQLFWKSRNLDFQRYAFWPNDSWLKVQTVGKKSSFWLISVHSVLTFSKMTRPLYANRKNGHFHPKFNHNTDFRLISCRSICRFWSIFRIFSKKFGLGSSIYWLTFLVSKNIFPLFSFKVKIIALRSKAKNPDLIKKYCKSSKTQTMFNELKKKKNWRKKIFKKSRKITDFEF